MQHLLELAIKIAVDAHQGQDDKAGQPYILHPLAVMLSVETTAEKIVAVLHDVVEDTSVSLDDLLENGLPPFIVKAVDAITKRKGEDYQTYLSRVCSDEIARSVKIKDIHHNLSRLSHLNPNEAGYLAKKYAGALQFIRHNENPKKDLTV
jgi:(p)ppGpp synthase/HD superfamily hydrolase